MEVKCRRYKLYPLWDRPGLSVPSGLGSEGRMRTAKIPSHLLGRLHLLYQQLFRLNTLDQFGPSLKYVKSNKQEKKNIFLPKIFLLSSLPPLKHNESQLCVLYKVYILYIYLVI